MQVVDHLSQVRRSDLGSLAFVPTMGALHAGHSALIRQAGKLTTSVLVSIFVNPLQFEDPADLEKYPRTPRLDIATAEESGARVLWIPTYDEIYPGPIERLDPGPIGALYEGAMRPGHFEGMLTVVKRLFGLVKPEWAFFGEKDFQQLFLIRKMVQELSLGVEIVAVPTVRQANGLAISSRNVRLSTKDQQVALVISRALTNASRMGTIIQMQHQLNATLSAQPGFTREYAVIIDESDFSPATESTAGKRALIAGWVNGVRLIDNMPMVGLPQ
jgi:pantoate--beta-alanine ligase